MNNNYRSAAKQRPVTRNQYYIDGNTARQLEVEYEQPAKRTAARKPQPKHRKRTSAFDLKYTLFLACAVAVILCSCIFYLTAKASLVSTERQISSMTDELLTLQEANKALNDSLNTPIDLEEVYRIATEDFGMVYADQSQVHYYTSNGGDYIRQYESIPTGR